MLNLWTSAAVFLSKKMTIHRIFIAITHRWLISHGTRPSQPTRCCKRTFPDRSSYSARKRWSFYHSFEKPVCSTCWNRSAGPSPDPFWHLSQADYWLDILERRLCLRRRYLCFWSLMPSTQVGEADFFHMATGGSSSCYEMLMGRSVLTILINSARQTWWHLLTCQD